MAKLFQKLFRLLKRDATGKTWKREITHAYFGPMIYYGNYDPSKGYWEAELAHPAQPKKFSVTLRGTPDGPHPSEQAFCQTILQDLDALFLKCRGAFEREFPEWTDQPFPSEWSKGFVLDGLSIPERGEPAANGTSATSPSRQVAISLLSSRRVELPAWSSMADGSHDRVFFSLVGAGSLV
jgi:hypothetical protein